MVEKVLAYLVALLGNGVTIRALDASERRRARWLANFYTLKVLVFRERRYILAFAEAGVRYTPAMVAKQFAMGREWLECDLIYVPRNLMAHDIPRLIAAGVPYIAVDRGVFLPDLGLSLTAPPKGSVSRETFSVATQLLLIGYLLKRWSGKLTLAEGVARTGFSMASIVNAFREIEHFGAGERQIAPDRTSVIELQPPEKIWSRCRATFFNPCKRTVGVLSAPEGSVVAGEDALATISALNEGDPTCFALPLKGFRERKLDLFSPESAPCQLQLWHYPPTFFDGHRIDPVSLLLSLRNATDDRVQIELQKLEETFQW